MNSFISLFVHSLCEGVTSLIHREKVIGMSIILRCVEVSNHLTPLIC